MRVILEGPDGVGKTTLAKRLADKFKCDIVHMTEHGSKRVADYNDKGKLDYIISDRSFLSELVYATVFDRPSKVSCHDVEELLKYYRYQGWQIVILDLDTSELVNRLNFRGDEAPEKINQLENLRLVYKALSYFFDIPIIYATQSNIDKLEQDLEAFKYVAHNRK